MQHHEQITSHDEAPSAGQPPVAPAIRRNPADVVRLYSRVAWAYETWGTIADSRVRRHVRELVRQSGGGHVVEAGCGTGALLINLARDNSHGFTVGLDLAPGMLAAARRRMARQQLGAVEIRRGDVRELILADNGVDTLTSSYVLDILPPDEIVAALTEFRRVLRPGGRLVLVNVTPAERRRHRIPELVYGIPLPLTSNCRGIRVAPLLHQLGFVDITRDYVSQIGLPSEVVCATRGVAPAG